MNEARGWGAIAPLDPTPNPTSSSFMHFSSNTKIKTPNQFDGTLESRGKVKQGVLEAGNEVK